jgi:hypothetical protein
MKTTGFARNVFVNCPFDKDYTPLLRPLLFTLLYPSHEGRFQEARTGHCAINDLLLFFLS